MGISWGIFDIFGYAIPGSLYLALFSYISDQFGWVNWSAISRINSAVLLIVAVAASYIVGHLAYGIARPIDQRINFRSKNMADARREFLREFRVLQAAPTCKQIDSSC